MTAHRSGSPATLTPVAGERAIEERLEELHAASFAWAVTCCGGAFDDAEETLQTTYLKILEGRARFAGRSSFKSWLFGVIRRTAGERWRRRRRRRELAGRWRVAYERRAAPADPLTAAADAERAARLAAAVDDLSRRQRQVLELVFYQDLTVVEAAAVLAIGVGSARRHYARGKRALLGKLGAEERRD